MEVRMELRIYVNTWKRYNEGTNGFYFDLGIEDNDDLEERLVDAFGDSDHEYFIQDYESIGFNVAEQTDFMELNEVLYELDEYNNDVFLAVCEFEGLDSAIEEAGSGFDSYRLYADVNDEEELGQYMVDEGLMGDIPKSIEMYLNYGAIGSDISMNTASEFTTYGYIERY